MNKTSPDIIIFTNGNLFSRIILEDFIKKYHDRISLVVIVSGDYFGNKGLHALFNFFKTTSFIYVLYKIWTLLLIHILRISDKSIRSSVEQLCEDLNVSTYSLYNINNPTLFEQVKSLKPRYLISVSCPQLIKQKWLHLVNGNGINIHSSLLPKYAGLAPYFWVLANNEKVTGTTVHYLVKGFDKGNILAQSTLPIENGISIFELFLNLCKEGKHRLVEAFIEMEKGNQGTEQDLTQFSYFSNPTSKAYFKLKKNGFSLFNLKDFKIIKKNLKNSDFLKYQ
jgi:folate-dependent phosphoribosylglycinamide formyltransferase PurN